MSGDCAFAPCFQTSWIAGYVVAEDVLTLIAMLSPNAPAAPLFARSGETAPFQTNSEPLLTAPDWRREPAFGSISYQRSSVPAPPYTACAVQIATALPCPGSTAATAASKRPSSVSRT